jgi:hypothetical protein
MTLLPDYTPPPALHASVAAGLAPLGVLLSFVLVVERLIALDTALAALAGCTVWVAVELHRYQRALDGYNAEYVCRHLGWRAPATLAGLAAHPRTSAATRDFVQRFIDDGCALRPDSPQLQ